MSRQSRPRIASLWTLVGVLVLSHPGGPAHAADDGSFSIEPEESFEDEEGDLREQLTEREDKRRPVKPWSIEVAGRPLAVSGEYEIAPGYSRRRVIGGAVG